MRDERGTISARDAALTALLIIATILVLMFLYQTRCAPSCDLFSDAASSVSGAPP